MKITQFMERVAERIRDWNVAVQSTLETETSLVAFGTRGNQPVVLKVIRQPGDEWRCGEVLRAFDGRGMVRVYEYTEGAVLLEMLNPGTSLAAVALNGRDEEATEIIADLIQRMSPAKSSNGFATAEDWGMGFQRYLASGDNQIPIGLVEEGQHRYTNLCLTQKGVRLLHGDLQHYNIVFDIERSWTAIDPKGVVGEIEYEFGAGLRNPNEGSDVFFSREAIQRRLRRYERQSKLDVNRVMEWAFAQAVLSAIWSIEDGFAVDANQPAIRLANAIHPMLE
jgi:streptomycin 6-kinase